MKVKLKDKLSRVLSLLLVVNMVLALVIATDTYYFDSGNTAYAAGTSSTMGSDNYTAKANITIGSRYSFGGYTWIAAQDLGNNTIALQSTGVTHGYWPGYAMAKFGGNANSYYNQDITGQDISGFDAKTQALYNTISYAQSGNSGLYLVSNAQAGSTSNGSSGSGYYWTALKEAATNYSSFGSPSYFAWLGTVDGGDYAWCVYSSGYVYNNYDQSYDYVVAPAFNLNTSKVTVSGSNIVAFSESTGISATKSSIQSIKEGQSVNLSSVISNVTYAGGTANGHTASYTVTCDKGTISGTTYTAPTNVTSSNDKVTFTVISTRNAGWKSTVQVNLAPNAAGKIDVVKSGNYPSEITSGDQIDFSNYLTVKAKDAAGNDDGTITDYDVTGDGFSGTGHVLTAGTVTDAKTITLTVTARQTIGTTSYDGKTYGSEDDEYAGKLTIKVKPGTNGYTDRDGYEDGKGFHKYEDKSTGITWNYKYDDSGNIRFLYTEDNVEKIISKGKVLLVPSSIGGVPVVGIGGGRKNEDTIPFIPTSGSKANNTWTSIYIPASVQYINDEAFAGNQASADIVIPSTVKQIGVGAFKGSKITSLAINTDSETMELFESAFEGIPTLKDVAIRGSHAIIGHYAFKDDTGITSIDIPHGTSFGKSSQNDSYAFAGTTGLELIKINTDTVYSNIFSGNKALKKVIFGDDVDYVNYDWSGTAATEGNQATLSSTVDRSTYVLNAETIFKMSKVTGGSPFGYKGKLTVVGKDHDLNKWENKYDNTNDPVIAKVAYLADNYKTNSDINKYAKGTADSITISVETDPSENEGVTSSVSKTQTGIEAYSTNIVLTGKNVEKDKVSVYKMFGTTQKDKYATEDFYVLRTTNAQTLLNKSVTATGNLSDAQQQITTISGNLQKTENDLATAQEALAEKQTDLDAANALIESTNAALAKAQGDLSSARSDLANVQKTLSDTQAELEATKTALNTANTSLAGAQQEITSLNAEVENLRNTIAGYQSVLNSIKKALGLTDAADNAEILASISDLDTRLGALDEKIASLAAMLGIDTAGKSDSDLMDEIISKVTDLTKDYDTVTKNYNKIVKKIYGADDTVDVSNKSVDEVLAAIDSLSGDTSAIAKQLQEAITGEKVSDSDVKQLTELLDQVKTMKSDLDEKSDLLNQIMQALGITDSAQIIQTIVNLKTQVASLEKENAELKAGGVTTGNTGKGYTKDTEVNRSSASYTSGYNAGYAKAAQDNAAGSFATQITSLTNSNSALTKENASLKAENETLSNGIDNLYDQVTNADVSMLSSTGSNTGSGKIQRIGNAINNLINDNQKASSKYKNLQSENKKLKNSNESLSAKIKTLTETNSKLSVSEKTLKSQVSSLKNRVNNVKEASSTAPSNVNRYNSVSNNNAGSTSNTASVKPSNRTSEGNIGTVSNQSNGTEEKSSDTGNTAKKKNKKSNANDTIESENITRNATLDASVGTERQLGEVLETMLPTTTTQAENQQATVSLNEIDDSKVVDITTNAKDTNNVTDEQKNNALKIVNWYMNNLEELGNLGSPEVKEAATDSTKSVTFDMLASFDVTPSDEQQNAIDNQQNVNLTVSSPDIEDGALYLVIHESDLRPNTFDVLLTQAFGNEIDINVPDLSPVTLTKITVGDSDVISSSSTQLSTEETPQEVTNNGKNNSGFKIVMYILIVVALGGAAALLIIAKRRKDGVSRK